MEEGGAEGTIMQEASSTSASEAIPSTLFFRGSIPDAIIGARTGNKILIVFVAGKDEESVNLERNTLNNSQVVNGVQQQCLVLRLEQGSTDEAHFSAIFPLRRVPTITLIGLNGVLLHQLEGYMTVEEFLVALQQASVTFNAQLERAAASTMVAMLSSASMSPASPSSPSTLPQRPSPLSGHSLHSSEQGQASDARHASGSTPPGPAQTLIPRDTENPTSAVTLSSEVVETQMEDDSQDVESSCVLGSTVTSEPLPEAPVGSSRASGLQQGKSSGRPEASIDTSSLSNLNSECFSPQEEDRHSQVVAVDSQVKVGKKRSSKGLHSELSSRKEMYDKRGPFLLQIRLTNGETIQGTFESLNVLNDVKEYVDANRTDGRTGYCLAVPFPRKVLANEDFQRTLIELELGPRSTLILVPAQSSPQDCSACPRVWRSQAPASSPQNSAPAAGGSLVGKLFSYINPFTYFHSGVSAERQDLPSSSRWQNNAGPSSTRDGSQLVPPVRPPYNTGGSLRGDDTAAGSLSQRKAWGVGGNVHTLRHDDDEAHTRGNMYWNGNSTQFGGDSDSKED